MPLNLLLQVHKALTSISELQQILRDKTAKLPSMFFDIGVAMDRTWIQFAKLQVFPVPFRIWLFKPTSYNSYSTLNSLFSLWIMSDCHLRLKMLLQSALDNWSIYLNSASDPLSSWNIMVRYEINCIRKCSSLPVSFDKLKCNISSKMISHLREK